MSTPPPILPKDPPIIQPPVLPVQTQNNNLRVCPDCRAWISKRAVMCPHCGRKHPKPTSPVAVLLIVLFLLGGGLGILSFLIPQNSSLVRPQGAPVRAETFTAVDRAKLPKLQKFVDDLFESGALTKAELGSSYVNITVSQSFYLLAFEQKKDLAETLLYYYSVKNGDWISLYFKDFHSGKEIASCIQGWGFKMK